MKELRVWGTAASTPQPTRLRQGDPPNSPVEEVSAGLVPGSHVPGEGGQQAGSSSVSSQFFIVTEVLPSPHLNSAPKLAPKLLFRIHKSRTVQAARNSEEGDRVDPMAPLMEARTRGGAPG